MLFSSLHDMANVAGRTGQEHLKKKKRNLSSKHALADQDKKKKKTSPSCHSVHIMVLNKIRGDQNEKSY